MGFDMYHRNIPTEERIESELLVSQLAVGYSRLPGLAGDTEELAVTREVNATLERELAVARKYYFRLNIWGMNSYYDAMVELGMVYGSAGPMTTDFDALEDLPTDYRAEQLATLLSSCEESPTGIASHKLGSNDGWHVTAEEVRAALGFWEARDESFISSQTLKVIGEDYWQAWLSFLQLATERDGFEVY